MEDIFVQEVPDDMKKCKCCNKLLPLTEFYLCGEAFLSKCKTCTTVERKAQALYKKHFSEKYEDWPEELKTYAEYFYTCDKAGGKVNYKNSPAEDLIRRYLISKGLNEQEEHEISGEVLLAINDRIADLERRISTLESMLQKQDTKSSKKKEAQELQERRNLLNKISMNPLLIDILGSDEDANNFCEKLLEAARKVASIGYLPGNDLRQIIVEFESVQEPFFDDILVFYAKFIAPGIAAAKERDDYKTNVELTESLLGYNAYEIDWKQIPLTIDM